MKHIIRIYKYYKSLSPILFSIDYSYQRNQVHVPLIRQIIILITNGSHMAANCVGSSFISQKTR